jgi:hypothetical protein
MTVTMAFAPPYPPLSAVLWVASMTVYVRGACHLAVFAIARGGKPLGRVYGWYALASGLTSVTALSVGWWRAGVLFGVMGAGCGLFWRRERTAGLNAASDGPDAE